jgi:hypothetical protein
MALGPRSRRWLGPRAQRMRGPRPRGRDPCSASAGAARAAHGAAQLGRSTLASRWCPHRRTGEGRGKRGVAHRRVDGGATRRCRRWRRVARRRGRWRRWHGSDWATAASDSDGRDAAREAGRAAVGRRTTVGTRREGEVSGRDSGGRDAFNPPRACPDSAAHGSQSGHGAAQHCR